MNDVTNMDVWMYDEYTPDEYVWMYGCKICP
jgi:hypothetical protein